MGGWFSIFKDIYFVNSTIFYLKNHLKLQQTSQNRQIWVGCLSNLWNNWTLNTKIQKKPKKLSTHKWAALPVELKKSQSWNAFWSIWDLNHQNQMFLQQWINLIIVTVLDDSSDLCALWKFRIKNDCWVKIHIKSQKIKMSWLLIQEFKRSNLLDPQVNHQSYKTTRSPKSKLLLLQSSLLLSSCR